MAAKPFVIFISPLGLGHAFRVAGAAGTRPVDVPAPPAATPDGFADAAAGALATLGYAGGGVLLAVPSAWCLCANVTSGDLPARGNRATLVYRLEEKLPVSAEDVVADFIPAADGATAFGVCVEKKVLAPLVESLESRGVAVEAIC